MVEFQHSSMTMPGVVGALWNMRMEKLLRVMVKLCLTLSKSLNSSILSSLHGPIGINRNSIQNHTEEKLEINGLHIT